MSPKASSVETQLEYRSARAATRRPTIRFGARMRFSLGIANCALSKRFQIMVLQVCRRAYGHTSNEQQLDGFARPSYVGYAGTPELGARITLSQ
jgi:hypothetical protein